jgi:hypothetical protein
MIRATTNYTSNTAAFLKRLHRRTERAADAGAAVVQGEMLKLTSGTEPMAQMRALGHPFARRVGRKRRGSLPLLPINTPGGFQLSLRIDRLPATDGQGRNIGFRDLRATWVLAPGGTRNTVDRGFWQALHAQAQPPVRSAVISALKGA